MERRTTAVTVRLGTVLNQKLQDRAKHESANCAELLRKALAAYLANVDEQSPMRAATETIIARLGSVEAKLTSEIRALVELPPEGDRQ